jgi:hypothetical protein
MPITRCGGFADRARSNWNGELVFISAALIGDLVGIAELETDGRVVRFCRNPDLSGIIPEMSTIRPVEQGTEQAAPPPGLPRKQGRGARARCVKFPL